MRSMLGFLGRPCLRLLVAGSAAGMAIFAVEAAFAYGLQAFLVAVGIMEPRAAQLPSWVPHDGLGAVFGLLMAVGAARGLLQGAQTYMQGAANNEFRHHARSRILRWALLSDSTSASDATLLFNARTEAAGSVIAGLQALAVQVPLALLLGAALLALAPGLTLLIGAAMLLLGLPLRWTDRRIKDSGDGLDREWETVNRRLLVSVKNLLLLQIYGTREEEEAKAQANLSRYRGHMLSYYAMTGLKYAFPQTAGVLVLCLTAYAAIAWRQTAPGLLVTYFYLVLRFLQIYTTSSQSYSSIQLYRPQFEQIFRWWQANDLGRRAAAPGEPPLPPARPLEGLVGWRLSRATFSYPGAGEPALRAQDLTVEPGSAVVIRGPSGVGKTTLLGVLLGLLQPQEGEVEVLLRDGPRPIQACRQALLRSIGYVGPETFLIEGTVRQNLAYGLDREPSEAEMRECLEMAEGRFVLDLPRGLEHPLTEQGQGLSAGQKQRLALARALLRRPRVLILDEATSNLDYDTEARLVKTLARLKGRLTIVAVTHREGVLKLADRVVELTPAAGPAAAVDASLL